MIEDKNAFVIKIAADLGRRIQREYPDIAEDYRGNYFSREIAEKYNISIKYGVGIRLASNAIRCALKGYSGGLGIEPYKGLIKEEEIKELSIGKLKANGKRNRETHKGIFGLDEETEKTRIKRSAESNGLVLWSSLELEDTYKMYQDPDYKYKEGLPGSYT